MSRSGYSEYDSYDEYDNWYQIMYRGAVASASRGKRGQTLFKEMLEALDALPEKKLIKGELELNGKVCALGAVGKKRGIDMSGIDPEYAEQVASTFNIATALAREVVYINDDGWYNETDEERFIRMRKWVVSQINSHD